MACYSIAFQNEWEWTFLEFVGTSCTGTQFFLPGSSSSINCTVWKYTKLSDAWILREIKSDLQDACRIRSRWFHEKLVNFFWISIHTVWDSSLPFMCFCFFREQNRQDFGTQTGRTRTSFWNESPSGVKITSSSAPLLLMFRKLTRASNIRPWLLIIFGNFQSPASVALT